MSSAFTDREKEKICSSVAFTLSGQFETDSNLMTMNRLNMSERDKVLLQHANFCAIALADILKEMVDWSEEDVNALIDEVMKEKSK